MPSPGAARQIAGILVRRAGVLIAVLALGACATRSAHYYADDGPPDRVPSGLESLPDAIPRVEPINPHANRPYSALGRSYTPDTGDAPFQQRGIASWYGRQFQGNRTASGEPYDMFAMSAAHPTLPIPSYARVTSVRDGRSIIVRINDRGPFLRDRVIDLSYAAATRLGIAARGSGEVVVEKITMRDIASGRVPSAPALAAAPPAPSPVATASVAAPPAAPIAAAGSVVATAVPAAASLAASPLVALGSGPSAPASAATPKSDPPAPGTAWSVQLGAFTVPENAERLRERVALLLSAPEAGALPASARIPRVESDGKFTRVLIGRIEDRAAAQAWAQQIGRFLMRDAVLYLR